MFSLFVLLVLVVWCVRSSLLSYARVAAPRRTVRVKPVPYAPGPSSPCAVRRGSWVSFPSIMTKMVYFSHPSLMSFSSHVYSTRAFMMRAHLLPR